MIGSIDSRDHEVTVVGAGVAGLLAAYYLDRRGYSVTLIEASDRAGGLVRTESTEWGMAESGPHSLQVTPAVRKLFDELGVPLLEVRENSRARFIFRRGRLRKFPLGLVEAVIAFLRAYFVLADRKANPERVTLEKWGLRHLGKAATRYLLNPFVRGIYGCRPSELDVGAAFPKLVIPRGHSLLSAFLWRRFRQKTEKAPRPVMMTPEEGMSAFVRRLEEQLERRLGNRFKKQFKINELPATRNVVLAVPAYEASRLLGQVAPQLAEALSRVSYTPLISATTFVSRAAFAAPVRGVGVLIPEAEKRDALGILFNSSCYPGRVLRETESYSFTTILGGTSKPELLDESDDRIREIVQREMQEILGAKGQVEYVHIFRWKKAVPQYNASIAEAWEVARSSWCSKPGRVLFGNYTGKISLRGMIEDAAKFEKLTS